MITVSSITVMESRARWMVMIFEAQFTTVSAGFTRLLAWERLEGIVSIYFKRCIVHARAITASRWRNINVSLHSTSKRSRCFADLMPF